MFQRQTSSAFPDNLMSRRAANIRNTEANGAPDAERLDPWRLVWGQPYIDSDRLAAAIEDDLRRDSQPDFRTRLLIRDAGRALRGFWGRSHFARWLATSPVCARVERILEEDLGEPGFPDIRRRLVSSIGTTQLKQIFDLLGRNIHDRVDIHVAGSIPTLVLGLTARPTTDIDLVNEVPAAIRQQHKVLEQIQTEYGLTLGHVQSHYLPANWQERRRYLGDFGGLRVYLVDAIDIFVSKLSSKQEKHQQDLRVLAEKLDRNTLRERLLRDGKAFLDDPFSRPQIEANWRFIFQEPLFADQAPTPEKQRGAGKNRRTRRKKRPDSR